MSLWATKTRFTNHNCSSDSETRAREDLSGIESPPVPVLSSNVEEMIERGDPLCSDTLEWLQDFRENLVDDRVPEHRDSQPDETTIERGNPSESEIPEWLQEFRENLVDDEIPLQGGSHASSSHEASLEPTTKRREDLRNHIVYTHFPKDRNCEICKRTKITRAKCRRRNGEAVPRAAKFGDLITADHKVPVLSDNCESRNNHRYAIVVQDLATQWIQAYPCKTNFTGNSKKLAKVLGAR